MFEEKITEILSRLSLEEKVGQLNLLGRSPIGGADVTLGDIQQMLKSGKFSEAEYESAINDIVVDGQEKEVAEGKVGGFLGYESSDAIRHLQKIAVEKSKSGIPLLIGLDVIHGLKTTFPIPLAESCSFDDELFELTAAAAAKESWNIGVDWTYSPMLHIARDARWGRIAEGSGQDTYLASRYAVAKVKGYQGDDLSVDGKIAACAKHFVAYGACEGGQDYNTVDMSLNKLWNVYMPPFKAAVEAGVASVMTAFNDLNGIPCTVNGYLLNDILKEQFDFDGVIVSDSMSLRECIDHGFAEDKKDAALKAIKSGLDMDMHSRCYVDHLCDMVRTGQVSEDKIDDAVRRILRLKFKLGLFDNPYREYGIERDEDLLNTNRELALRAARESIVLLKNDNVLPLKANVKIAVIGDLADSAREMLGMWAVDKSAITPVSLLEGIKSRAKCEFFNVAERLEKRKDEFDVVIVAIGESKSQSGEAASRAYIGLSENDILLLNKAKATGKKVVTVLFNGRPMAIPEAVALSDAIVEAWHLGIEAGNAISDIIFGDYNPSGRLTASFPNESGQSPFYYNHMKTGKPASDMRFTSRYLETPIKPLYPFGYGLSYTEYSYKDLSVTVEENEIIAGATVENIGDFDGVEVVQLYIQDVVGSIVRPVKELKGYQRIALKAKEKKQVTFILEKSELGFYDYNLNYVVEAGKFKLWIGHDSDAMLCEEFEL